MKRQRGRNRNNNNNNHNNNNPNRSLDSNGPDVKVRGTASTIYDKYVSLANDAQSSGNRVKAESLRQHAEHYLRLMNTQEAAKQAAQAARDEAAAATQAAQAAAAATRAEKQEKSGQHDGKIEGTKPDNDEGAKPRRQHARSRKEGHNHNTKKESRSDSDALDLVTTTIVTTGGPETLAEASSETLSTAAKVQKKPRAKSSEKIEVKTEVEPVADNDEVQEKPKRHRKAPPRKASSDTRVDKTVEKTIDAAE